jgi:hypothetical protein
MIRRFFMPISPHTPSLPPFLGICGAMKPALAIDYPRTLAGRERECSACANVTHQHDNDGFGKKERKKSRTWANVYKNMVDYWTSTDRNILFIDRKGPPLTVTCHDFSFCTKRL